jgi:hypothetical protein
VAILFRHHHPSFRANIAAIISRWWKTTMASLTIS